MTATIFANLPSPEQLISNASISAMAALSIIWGCHRNVANRRSVTTLQRLVLPFALMVTPKRAVMFPLVLAVLLLPSYYGAKRTANVSQFSNDTSTSLAPVPSLAKTLITYVALWLPVYGAALCCMHLLLSEMQQRLHPFFNQQPVPKWWSRPFRFLLFDDARMRVTLLRHSSRLSRATTLFLDSCFRYSLVKRLTVFAVYGAVLLGDALIEHWTWPLADVLSISLAVCLIEWTSVRTFKTGLLFLAGVSAFDLFFVYGVNLLGTVVTHTTAPLLVYFPKQLFTVSTDAVPLTRLGTIDFIFPAVLLSLVLDYCRQEDRRTGATTNVVFWSGLLGFLLGLWATFAVAFVTKRTTPALPLPSLGCAVFSLVAAARKPVKGGSLWNYSLVSDDIGS